MKTDFQRFQDFFDEMNIKYDIYEGRMWVDDVHLAPNYSATLEIRFDNDGKFVEFETWGE